MTVIHPTAIVDQGAVLGKGVRIGPLCYVEAGVVLGDNVELISHVVVLSGTTIGAGSKVSPNAILGGDPQSYKHSGGPSTLEIGENCIIREGVTMHRGTDSSRARTTVGDNCMFMALSHVAHDCEVGNNVTMSNNTCLGGHVVVGDNVIISGYAAVHQFARVGHHAFLGAFAAVMGDLIPFGMAVGNQAHLKGLNIIGMRRSGYSREQIFEARRAYKMIFSQASAFIENLEQAQKTFSGSVTANEIINFLSVRNKRQYVVPKLKSVRIDEDDSGEE